MDPLFAALFSHTRRYQLARFFYSFVARSWLFPIAAIRAILLVAKTSTKSPWSPAIASSQPLNGGRQRHHEAMVRELWQQRREKDTRAGGVSPSSKNTHVKPCGLLHICIIWLSICQVAKFAKANCQTIGQWRSQNFKFGYSYFHKINL